MNKKILIPIVLVLLIGGYEGYSMATAKPAPKQKIPGQIYVLPKPFTLNLADGRYTTLTVGLVLDASVTIPAADPSNPPPDGFGDLPEEAAIRDIITNVVTDQKSSALITDAGRGRLKRLILRQIAAHTDTKVDGILLTDVAVQ